MVIRLSILFLAALLIPGWAAALGLGEIKLSSRLNQPLVAEIPLFAVRPNDVESMKIALANAAQFRRAGVERAFHLTRIRFRGVDNGDGTGSIRVTTSQPVNEPFLNFLVEVDWQTGRLVREFTLLLDPPVYGAAVTSTVARAVPTVKAPAPRPLARAPEPAVRRAAGPGIRSGPFADRAAGLNVERGAVPAATAPSASVASRDGGGGTYGPVRRSDTMWSLASRLRPDRSVSVHQMMLAILDANPRAFINGNVNALRAGSVLRVPTLNEIQGIDRRTALAEIRKQNTAWEDVRRGLAARAAARQGAGTASQSAPVSESTPVRDAGSEPAAADSQAAAEPADGDTPAAQTDNGASPADATTGDGQGTLQIVGAGAGDAAGEGASEEVSRLSAEVDLVREELALSRNETEDLKSKLEQAETIILDMERLAQIRDDQLAQLQQQLASTQGALEQAAQKLESAAAAPQPGVDEVAPQGGAPSVEAPSDEAPSDEAPSDETAKAGPGDGSTASGQDATQPAPQPEPQPGTKPVPPPPPVAPPEQPKGFVDELMAMATSLDPSVLIGSGGLIMVLLGFGWFLSRRKKNAAGDNSTLEEVMMDKASAGEALDDAEATLVSDTLPPAAPATSAEPADTAALFDEADTETVAVLDEPADELTEFGATMRADQLQEEDPLQEANVYLAYERFDQAEQVVKDAIESHPDRPAYRVKLLEIYHGMRNRAAFDQALQGLQAEVPADSELLVQAASLAENFPTSEAGDTGVDLDLGTSDSGDTADGGVDFDLGFALGDETDEDQISTDDVEAAASVTGSDTSVDFVLDTGDAGPSVAGAIAGTAAVAGVAAAAAATRVGSNTDVDFDLGEPGGTDDGGAASSLNMTDASGTQVLDFDVAFGDTNAGGPTPPDEAESTGSVDFDLDFDAGELSPGASATGTDDAEASMDLDFDLDFGDDSAAEGGVTGATATGTGDPMIPGEAYETVQLNLDTVDGGEDGSSAPPPGGETPDTIVHLGGDDTETGSFGDLDLDFALDSGDETPEESSQDTGNLIDTVTIMRPEAGGESLDLEAEAGDVLGPSAASDSLDLDAGLESDSLDFGLDLPSDSDAESAPTLAFPEETSAGTGDVGGDTSDIALELPAETDEDTVAFDLDLDDEGGDIQLDLGQETDDDDVFLNIGDDDGAEQAPSIAAPASDTLDVGIAEEDELTLDLDAALSAVDAASKAQSEQGDLDAAAQADEDMLQLDESLLDAQGPADSGGMDAALGFDTDALELPDDETQAGADIAIQMPDQPTTEFNRAVLGLNEAAESKDGAGLVVDSDSDEDTSDLLSDLMLPEETVDTSEIDLEADFDAALLADADAAPGTQDDSETGIEFDLGDLDLGDDGDEASAEEQTIDVDPTEDDADDLLDINFDPADIPDEALDTQTHLAAELAGDDDHDDDDHDDDDEGGESARTVLLDAPGPGVGVDTTDMGSAVGANDADDDDLDFDLGVFGDGGSEAETMVADSSASIDLGEATEGDLSDFDPLAGTHIGEAGESAPVDASDEPTLDFDISSFGGGDDETLLELGDVDDEDAEETIMLDSALSRDVDEMQTKLDLAKEFVDLGDTDAAREALQEVIADGDASQQQSAREMLDRLS